MDGNGVQDDLGISCLRDELRVTLSEEGAQAELESSCAFTQEDSNSGPQHSEFIAIAWVSTW